jgi:hypothetical protein
VLYPAQQQPLMGRYSTGPSECPGEVAHRQPTDRREPKATHHRIIEVVRRCCTYTGEGASSVSRCDVVEDGPISTW